MTSAKPRRSRSLIERLVDEGASVKAYDPVAAESARRSLPSEWIESGKVELVGRQYQAVDSVDALALVTEWKPFRNPDFELMKKSMRLPLIFDGRNQYDPKHLKSMGFEYFGIGR